MWRWVRAYGGEELLAKRIRIETPEEVDAMKEARERIRELEAALADTHVELLLERTFLEKACQRLGMTVEVFKKSTPRSCPRSVGERASHEAESIGADVECEGGDEPTKRIQRASESTTEGSG